VRLREHILEHGEVGDAGRGDGRLHRERELTDERGVAEVLNLVPKPPFNVKIQNLPGFSVLTMKRPHTKPPPYDFLSLYGACMRCRLPGTEEPKN
jgi:hypothetical protein